MSVRFDKQKLRGDVETVQGSQYTNIEQMQPLQYKYVYSLSLNF